MTATANRHWRDRKHFPAACSPRGFRRQSLQVKQPDQKRQDHSNSTEKRIVSMDERVMVVPTDLFRELGYFQGFCPHVDRYFATLTDPANTSYRLRREVEEDPSFKQLIPYVIFQHVQDGQPTLFQYTRGSGQGEGRLHSKRSIGIGGHISADDAEGTKSGGAPYDIGLQRELDEEVCIETPFTARCVGLINDDETPVGQVHLGVVYLYDCQQPDVSPRESEIMETGFRPVAELLDGLERFESWSQICLTALFGEQGALTAEGVETG